MARDAFVDTWDPEWETTKGSVAQWRREHPRATLREIEEAVDWQVNALRARMLQDVAMASGAAQFAHAPAASEVDLRAVDRQRQAHSRASLEDLCSLACKIMSHTPEAVRP